MMEQQLSSHPELGALQKTCRDWGMWLGFVAFTVIVICLSIAILSDGLNHLAFIILIALLYMFSLVRVLYQHKRAIRIAVYKEGFVYQIRDKQKAIFWSDIRYIRRKVSDNWNADDVAGPLYTYSFYKMNGKGLLTLSFDGRWQRQERMVVAMIEQATSALLFPPALEAYQQGKDCWFGHLRLSLQGISYKENILPWNEVQSFEFKIDAIRIKSSGDKFLKKWATIPLENIYNLDVVKMLVEVVTSTHHFQITIPA